MKLIYTSFDLIQVNNVRNLLAAYGIAATLRNEFLGGAAGELPLNEVWPELWVEDHYAVRAQDLINEYETSEETVTAWHCPCCGELIEGQFSQCWSCSTMRPTEEAHGDNQP